MANGVDLEFFAPDHAGRVPGTGPNIVFTGMMDYWPNIEGVRWFISDVYPKIRDVVPGARLLVVGGRPKAEVLRWGDEPGITVTGFVDDIREYLAAADVCNPDEMARALSQLLGAP